MLSAQNPTVAETIVGIDDFNFMEIQKENTRGTFVHAQKSSACAFRSLVKLLSLLLINALQNLTKQSNTEYAIHWVCANVRLRNV